jgi:metallo-beta-lactamase class B
MTQQIVRAAFAAALAAALATIVGPGLVAAQAADVERHIAAAKAAAGADHTGLFDRVCSSARTLGRQGGAARAGGAGAGQAGRQGGPPAPPARESWHAEPAKVFDNLYYVGMTEYSAWAVTTSAGIILIDAIFDYSVEDEVVGGLKKLGLDPAQIKYVVVSHGHGDHAAGAKFLQDKFGARVVMSAADYDTLDQQNPSWKPRRDIVATDGYKLTLGDTTLTLYLTPGHTLGTISTLVPVRDGDRSHLAAAWGGTAFNFGPIKERLQMYVDSSARFRDIVQKAGADVLIANHTVFDGSKTKIPALATRKPGQPHPYVIGPDAVRRYLTVANECGQAALASFS